MWCCYINVVYRILKINIYSKVWCDVLFYYYDAISDAFYMYDLYGNLLNVYPSMTIAATAIKGSVSAISQVCSGKLKSHKSFIWKKLV